MSTQNCTILLSVCKRKILQSQEHLFHAVPFTHSQALPCSSTLSPSAPATHHALPALNSRKGKQRADVKQLQTEKCRNVFMLNYFRNNNTNWYPNLSPSWIVLLFVLTLNEFLRFIWGQLFMNSSLILVPWFEYLLLGCHIGLSLVCNLDVKHVQGTHGNLLWVAGRDGNVYEGNPLKQLRTTKTTISNKKQ